jgi:hypothetical protein
VRNRVFVLSVVGILFTINIMAQTSTVTSGNWSDGSVWSTGSIPANTATVNVSHPITLDQNITITTGTYNFGYDGTANVIVNVTDAPAGTAYTLTMTTSGGTLDIKSGTTTFEGAASLDNSTLYVRNGATLILGATTINNGTHITVEAGGTLIVNGDFTNNNNGSGSFSLAGSVQINGNYSAPIGSVDITGAGSFDTTGTITTTGSSNVFGFTNDCTSGPCSGSTLSCSFTNTVSPTSKVACSGSTSGTLTATTSGGTPTYQWQSSTTSSSSGFANIGSATSSTYTSGALTQTTWFRVAVTSGSCTSYSAATKVSVLSGGGWKGTTNDWGTATNWCSGAVPTSSIDVTISPFATGSGLFYPVIASGTNANVANLTIDNGASVTVSSGGTLSIYKNFTNNGSFTDNTTAAGGVSLKGTIAQTISGATANTFSNLTISNSAGTVPAVNINSNNVTVTSNLVMSSGVINLTGFTVTLGASAASSGTLTYSSGTRFYNGNITRWFPTAAVTLGTAASLYPIGSSADYRPMYFGNAGLTAGGTIKVSHTSISASTAASFTDDVAMAATSKSYWTVSTANAIGTGTFSIRTEGTGFGTVGAVTDLRLSYAAAKAAGSPGTNAGTTSNPQVNRTGINTASVSLAANYYWSSINSTATPLPIHLLSFSGTGTQEGIKLQWITTLEENFDYFILERSADGKNFSGVQTIVAKGGYDTRTEYTYMDGSTRRGEYYYRLKNVDLDGTYDYSKIIRVDQQFNASAIANIYPNPTVDRKFTVSLIEQGGAQLHVYDSFGNKIREIHLVEGDQQVEFDRDVAPGVYHAYINSQNSRQVFKIIIK